MTTRTYDGNNNLLTETDPLGRTTTVHLRRQRQRPDHDRPARQRHAQHLPDHRPGLFEASGRPTRQLPGHAPPTRSATRPPTPTTARGNLTSTTDAAGNVTQLHLRRRRQPDLDHRRGRQRHHASRTTARPPDAADRRPGPRDDLHLRRQRQPAHPDDHADDPDAAAHPGHDDRLRRQRPADIGHRRRGAHHHDRVRRRSATRSPRSTPWATARVHLRRPRPARRDRLRRRHQDDHDLRRRRPPHRLDRPGRPDHELRLRRAGPADRDDRARRHPGRPDGQPATKTEYDAAGQVTAQIDELGHRTDVRVRRRRPADVVRDALGNDDDHAYDAAGPPHRRRPTPSATPRTSSTTPSAG